MKDCADVSQGHASRPGSSASAAILLAQARHERPGQASRSGSERFTSGASILLRPSYGACNRRQGSIERLEVDDLAPPATRQVAEIPCAKGRELFVKLPGEGYVRTLQRPDLDPQSGNERQCRVERLPPVGGKTGMHQFLQHLGGGAQGRMAGYRVEELAGQVLKRVRSAHCAHEDIGCRRRSRVRRTASVRLIDDGEVLIPVGFHIGTFKGIALGKKGVQIRSRLESPDLQLPIEPLKGRGTQPRAQRQSLPMCLVNEPGTVIVRDHQLDSGH